MERTGNDGAVEQRLSAAVAIAREAGERTLPAFRAGRFGIETKRDGSVVTEVDRNTEAWIRDQVRERFAGDALVGEEHGALTGDSGFRWVIDPIDGTASFVHGVPLYGTLVAVQEHRSGRGGLENEEAWESVVGVIAMPALGEMVYAREGGGCWHIAPGSGEARRARASRVSALDEAVVCTTSIDYFVKTSSQQVYERLAAASGLMRGWSDCYAHVLVATGRAEAALEPMISLWDIAAMPVIMTEAGGRYSDLEGRAGSHWKTGLSTNGLIHEAVLSAIRG